MARDNESIIHNPFYDDSLTAHAEVQNMPLPIGLLFTGLIIRTLLGAALVVAVVWLLWKLAKLADAYAEKLKASAKQQ